MSAVALRPTHYLSTILPSQYLQRGRPRTEGLLPGGLFNAEFSTSHRFAFGPLVNLSRSFQEAHCSLFYVTEFDVEMCFQKCLLPLSLTLSAYNLSAYLMTPKVKNYERFIKSKIYNDFCSVN